MIKRKFQLILSLVILSQKVLMKAAADKIWMLCCKEKDGITNRNLDAEKEHNRNVIK